MPKFNSKDEYEKWKARKGKEAEERRERLTVDANSKPNNNVPPSTHNNTKKKRVKAWGLIILSFSLIVGIIGILIFSRMSSSRDTAPQASQQESQSGLETNAENLQPPLNGYKWTDKDGITYIVDDLSKLPPDYQKRFLDRAEDVTQTKSTAYRSDGRSLFAGSWIEKEDLYEFRDERVAVRLDVNGSGYALIPSLRRIVRKNFLWRELGNDSIGIIDEDDKNSRTVKYNPILNEIENRFGGHYPLRRMKKALPPPERILSREAPYLGCWESNREHAIASHQFLTIERDGTGVLFPTQQFFTLFTWSLSKTGDLDLQFQFVMNMEQGPDQSEYVKEKGTVHYDEKTDMLFLTVGERQELLIRAGNTMAYSTGPRKEVVKKLEMFGGKKMLTTASYARIAFLSAAFYRYSTLTQRKEGIPWLTIAAEGGIAEAQYMLGLFQYFGDDRPVDKEAGLRWIQQAMKSNNASAVAFLERIEQGGKASSKYFGYENPLNYWERGSKLVDEGKYDEAIENLTKAIILNKGEISTENIANVYHARGLVYSRRAQYAEALADFNAALKSTDKNGHIYNSIGLVQTSMNQYERAIEAFNMAISLNPKGVAPYIGRGIVYKKQNRYSEAIQEFDKGNAIEPKSCLTMYHKASVYSLMNKTHEACDEFDKAIECGLSKRNDMKTAIQRNADFDNIRQSECFSRALSRMGPE